MLDDARRITADIPGLNRIPTELAPARPMPRLKIKRGRVTEQLRYVGYIAESLVGAKREINAVDILHLSELESWLLGRRKIKRQYVRFR